MTGYLQDAAEAAHELMDAVYKGEVWDWEEEDEWDVHNAAVDLMKAIGRFREQARERS